MSLNIMKNYVQCWEYKFASRRILWSEFWDGLVQGVNWKDHSANRMMDGLEVGGKDSPWKAVSITREINNEALNWREVSGFREKRAGSRDSENLELTRLGVGFWKQRKIIFCTWDDAGVEDGLASEWWWLPRRKQKGVWVWEKWWVHIGTCWLIDASEPDKAAKILCLTQWVTSSYMGENQESQRWSHLPKAQK